MRNYPGAKFRIHHVYYCLAAFDILVLAVSLGINRSNVTNFEESISINRKFISESNAAEKLSELSALSNAPGNDVFDSRDPQKERRRLSSAVAKYQVFYKNMVAQTGEPGREELAKALTQIDYAMNDMLLMAESIFRDFERGNEKSAASKMASMDKKYAALNSELARFRGLLIGMQAKALNAEAEDTKAASELAHLLGFCVVFMVLLVTWFGHLMQKKAALQEAILRENSKTIALGEMAGGIAHEINNPLAIVRTRLSQLKRLISAERFESAQAIKFLQDIEDTSIRMSKIVAGLNTFSRSSENDEKTPVQLTKLLSDVQGICQDRLHSKGIAFEVTNVDEIEIACRPVQIEQILVNLVNNAVDAISETNAPWVRLNAKRAGAKEIEISITDSGTGIPDKIADKLMQPLFTTKPVGKGTGLGLSISVGIAEAHGGTLKLNREHKNTQFILTLPIAVENQKTEKLTA
jgi:signal transduction histidine kinase